jgi:hypothetical protein
MSPKIIAALIGIAGFIGGFCAGQMLLYFMLRHKSREDLKNDRSLRIYGILNWLIAGLGSAAFIMVYHRYYS